LVEGFRQQTEIFFEVSQHQNEELLAVMWAVFQALLNQMPHSFEFLASINLDEA
jgi:hypothetical protein